MYACPFLNSICSFHISCSDVRQFEWKLMHIPNSWRTSIEIIKGTSIGTIYVLKSKKEFSGVGIRATKKPMLWCVTTLTRNE